MILNGFVQTPKEIIDILLQHEKFIGNILEPCCGKGAISDILKDHKYSVISSDIINYGYGEVIDVFDINKTYDNIITNPPFALKIPMVRHLLGITNNKLCLLWYVKNIGNIIESKISVGLKNIYVFNQRINWKETKLGWLFAWYVWEKNYIGDINIKRINFLTNN
jgi:hypothetical protein